jgi:hypothetical protein
MSTAVHRLDKEAAGSMLDVCTQVRAQQAAAARYGKGAHYVACTRQQQQRRQWRRYAGQTDPHGMQGRTGTVSASLATASPSTCQQLQMHSVAYRMGKGPCRG